MKVLLESSISWNRIEKLPKDNFLYHVEKATLEKKTNILFIEISMNFIIPPEDEQRMEMIIKHEYPKIGKVNLHFNYKEKLPAEAMILRSNIKIKQNQKPQEKTQLIGKAIHAESIALSEIQRESGSVVVTGHIFQIEVKSIKNNRQLIILLITDSANSACIKFFITERKWKDIETQIREGDYIKVRGNAEYDNFEMAV
ncbi:MAG: hypothetical protein PHE41_04805, partial [Eubacteriales bacterium]|nr:hypothetical protein [Eubacteriales bacterium]